MATFDVAIPQEVLRGLPLLRDLITNHSVGVFPHETVREIRATYGVDIADLRAAAVGQDANEQHMLELKALERAAYAMGKHDGARVVAHRRGLSSGMDLEDFQAVVDVSSSIPQERAAYTAVTDAYVRGMRTIAARLYVSRNAPLERRRQLAEARVVRGQRDPVRAEDLVETCRAALDTAIDTDPVSYVTALAAYAVAEETANAVAEDAIADRVVEIVQAAPGMTVTEAIQRARLSYRTAAGSDLSRRSAARAAWAGISMQVVNERLQEAVKAAVTVERSPAQRPGRQARI